MLTIDLIKYLYINHFFEKTIQFPKRTIEFPKITIKFQNKLNSISKTKFY